MRVSYFIVLTTLFRAFCPADANPWKFTACVTGCYATCALPGNITPCASCDNICRKLPDSSCYGDDTELVTEDGVKSIREVQQGDHVLTMKSGSEHWTKVTFNRRLLMTVPGTYIQAVDDESGETFEMQVTESHGVPCVSKDIMESHVSKDIMKNKGLIESFEAHADVIAASLVNVGDTIQVMSESKQKSLAKVTSVKETSMASKNVLYTSVGTVLANRILTAATCDLMKEEKSFKIFLEEIDRNAQECVSDAVSPENYAMTLAKAGAIGLDQDKAYPVDLFLHLMEECVSVTDISKYLAPYAEGLSPNFMDNAAIIHMVMVKEVSDSDVNGDGMIDHNDIPDLEAGVTVTPLSMNPYLCDACTIPMDPNIFSSNNNLRSVG